MKSYSCFLLLMLLFFSSSSVHSKTSFMKASEESFWRKLRDGLKPLKCSDISLWQKYLNQVATKGKGLSTFTYYLNEKKCLKTWSSEQKQCLSNMNQYLQGKNAFSSAGQRQRQHFREQWYQVNDFSDIFDCGIHTTIRAGENGEDDVRHLQVCEPLQRWPQTFLDCIRHPKKNKNNPVCRRVKGWCAVQMGRHHEASMDTNKTIVFYNPKKKRFILNADPGGTFGSQDQVVETLTVLPPQKKGDYWRGVFSIYGEGGLMHSPSNHSQVSGCWHCHPAGGPRKLDPLWGSIAKEDQKGLECINDAISKMGPFTTDHLWKNEHLGPSRGGSIMNMESCGTCHGGTAHRMYYSRGRLFRNSLMSREMLAKMTSWSRSMPLGGFGHISGFEQAQKTLGKVNHVPNEIREQVFKKYTSLYQINMRALLRKKSQSPYQLKRKQLMALRHPEVSRGDLKILLEAHEKTQVEALETLARLTQSSKLISKKEIKNVKRVLKEVNESGLSLFFKILKEDRKEFKDWMAGEKNNCLIKDSKK